MNNMKKLASLLLALVMVLAMAAPAMAATITINGGASGSKYAAYKLLNATDGGEGKFAYTLNDKYTDILKDVTKKENQADIVAYIAGLDTAGIRAFADAVYAEITAADSAIVADYTATANEFANVDQGYYLIAETKVGDTADTFSLVMLDTAGNEEITVNTKEDKPTVEKKVEDKNDSTGGTGWGDSADHDVGDVINYKITGTVSDKYAGYKSYYYSFSDTMAPGLTLNEGSIKVMIGDVDVTNQFTIVYNVTDDTATPTADSFTATANLKELTDVTVTGETEVVVTYTATLNEYAVMGSAGNKNTVVLEYENNPYHESDGDLETPDEPEEPGKTPEDVNIVFTYNVVVNKVEKVKVENPDYDPAVEGSQEYIEQTVALKGAGFTLYKKNAEGDYVAVGAEIKGTEMTTFTWNRLDDGDYKLVETTVPAGYNKMLDIEFTITAEHDLESDDPQLTKLEGGNLFTGNITTGTLTTDVENIPGAELPETGGMGTTMIYVIGCLMVAGAAIVLFAKKRAAK